VTATATDEDIVHPVRSQLLLALAALITVPGSRCASRPPTSPTREALLFGLAIVGAAFILSWGAEAAQIDISAGLAVALLALIAVLPEYAVDFVFATRPGTRSPSSAASVRRRAAAARHPARWPSPT